MELRFGFLLPMVGAMSLLVSGCGYQAGSGGSAETDAGQASAQGWQWRSLYRQDVRTVAVPVITNKTYQRGLDLALTKAVVTQLEAHSPYRVSSRDRADTILECELTDARMRTISRDYETNLPKEQLMMVTVDFTWKDLRDGRILLERRGFRYSTTYYPQLAEGQFVADQQSVEKLALLMVQEMQADW